MITGRHLVGVCLILCWAILLSAQYVAAAIYLGGTHSTYHPDELSVLLPVCAWFSLLGGIVTLNFEALRQLLKYVEPTQD